MSAVTALIQMSTGHTTPGSKNLPGTAEVSISEHALLRYRERVDPLERCIRLRIREEFKNGREARIKGFEDPARVNDGVAYVYDPREREVITVLEPRDEQLADVQVETDASAGWREEYEHQGVRGHGHE